MTAADERGDDELDLLPLAWTTVSMLSRNRSASRAALWNGSDPSTRAASVDSIVSLDCRTPRPPRPLRRARRRFVRET